MAIVGSNAGRASFQYFNGSNYVEAQTPGGNNALMELSVQDIIYNPMKVSATLINKASNPRSGTASSTKGNLTGTITEFMKVRIVDSYSKQIIFSGFAEDVAEKYVMGLGNILVVKCYDNLYELREFRTDAMTKMDTTESVYNRRSKLIAKMIDYSSKSGNIATSDTDQFETSTIEFPNETGDFMPKEAGKSVLAAIKQISSTEPHTGLPSASVSQTAFGHDYYLAPQFTSTATSATQTPMLNYFKRATRPNTEANMDTYGMKIVFPLSSSDVEGGQTRRMLSDFDFDRVRTDVFSEAELKFVDKGGGDGSNQGQDKKFAPLRIARLNPTQIGGASGAGAGTFTWTGRPIAGDYTVNGNYIYTDGKEGFVHGINSSQDELGGGWLIRMWADTIGSGGNGAYRHNVGDDIAKTTNSKWGFENSWMKYIGVPENDNNNSTPCGKVRLSSISTTNLASKNEVVINTATSHFLEAGDRFLLTNISLGATGEVTEAAQRFKSRNANGRAFGREIIVATQAGSIGSSGTTLYVHKDQKLSTSTTVADARIDQNGGSDIDEFVEPGKDVRIEGNAEIFTVSAIATGEQTPLVGDRKIGEDLDKITIDRAQLGTSGVASDMTSQVFSKNIVMSQHVGALTNSGGGEDTVAQKEQEGAAGAIFDHNIFRVEKVISNTQFIVKSELGAVSWTSGTLKCGQLDGAIDDSASTTDITLEVSTDIRAVHVQAGMIIKIGSEEMLVKTATYDSQDADLVVERGYNGTTRASHSDNAEVISMLSHVIPVVGRAQYQTKLNSWSAGTDYMLVSDLNSNFPSTGKFRLTEINYSDDSYGTYAEFDSSSQTINRADVIGFNKPKNMVVSPMDKNADAIRVSVAEALSHESETRGGTVRINNYAYQYIDGTANAVAGSGTIVTTYNTANNAVLNPKAYGLRVGMVAWKLSGSSMAAYGYVSAVTTTTFTVTLNSGTFSADDKFRIFVPLRTGHLVQIKNKLVGIDTTSSNTFSDNQTSFMVTSIDYTEGQGQQNSTITLVKADEGNTAIQSAFTKIAGETESQAFSATEDSTTSETEPPSIDITFKPGVVLSNASGDNSPSNIIRHLDRGVHWGAGVLKYKGEEYKIPAGNSTDGWNIDDASTSAPMSPSAIGAQLFTNTDIVDSEGRTDSNGGGADGYPDSYHVCFVDLGNATGEVRLMWVDVQTYEANVKDRATKLIIAEGHADVSSSGKAHVKYKIKHVGRGAEQVRESNYVGQGFGLGSAAAPMLAFDGDRTTGIFSSGDGFISFAADGDQEASISDTGYIFVTNGVVFAGSGLANSNNFIFASGSGASRVIQFNTDDGSSGNASRMRLYSGGMILDTIGTDAGTNLVINSSNLVVKESSSKRYKKDIKDSLVPTEKIYDLEPKDFVWKSSNKSDVGLIAEEVAEILPEFTISDAEGKVESVRYNLLTVALIAELKKLKNEITELKENLDA